MALILLSNMSSELIISLLVTTVVAIVGWYAAHRLSAARDRANKRRELRVQYLIEAHRRLENASNRPDLRVVASEFEKAIADIQLFGTPRQVALAREFAVGFARVGTHSLDPQ
jgi:Tfp pilus assembly protein PilO